MVLKTICILYNLCIFYNPYLYKTVVYCTGIQAPKHDLQLVKYLVQYRNIDKEVADKALSKIVIFDTLVRNKLLFHISMILWKIISKQK